MADHDHFLAQGESLFHRIEFFPKDRRGMWIGIAARVAVEPDLVVFANLWITAQLIDHRGPGRGRIHEPVHDKHDGLIRIVGLEP